MYAALEAALQSHLHTVRYHRARRRLESKPQAVAAAPAAADPARDATLISKGKRRRDRRKRAQAARTQGEAAALADAMQTEDGGVAATPPPESTPQERDNSVRSPAEAAAWAKAPPFVPGAKEKAAAVAAAPVADSRGHARADKAAKNPKLAPSFAEALRGKFAAPASASVKAHSQAPGVKRELSPSNSPVKNKDAKTPKTVSNVVPAVFASNEWKGGRIVMSDGRKFEVEDVEDEEDEEEVELYICNHAHIFGSCKLTGCVAVSPAMTSAANKYGRLSSPKSADL
jgi:hypothetical protein